MSIANDEAACWSFVLGGYEKQTTATGGIFYPTYLPWLLWWPPKNETSSFGLQGTTSVPLSERWDRGRVMEDLDPRTPNVCAVTNITVTLTW
jgi:hypothetical protein